MRKFEKISLVKCDIPMPKRSTAKSAGYDICIIHPLVWEIITDPESKMNTLEEAWDTVQKYHQEIFYIQ